MPLVSVKKIKAVYLPVGASRRIGWRLGSELAGILAEAFAPMLELLILCPQTAGGRNIGVRVSRIGIAPVQPSAADIPGRID